MSLGPTLQPAPAPAGAGASSALASGVPGEAPPPAEGLPRGTCIGRYVITGELGVGGMGVVYAAYDPDLCRCVAIKLLRGNSADAHARFLREAQSMARLSHENVIAVYDVGLWPALPGLQGMRSSAPLPAFVDSSQQSGAPSGPKSSAQQAMLVCGPLRSRAFLAMELVEGGTLTEWLKREPRPFRKILDPFIKAGRGLAAAHAAGLIHRDFKPDNVLCGKDGRVRVVDFGLVRADSLGPEKPADESGPTLLGDALSEGQLTRAGAIMGTPAFMSLEQFEGRPIDARADQFSFCVALYTALYGEAPYPGKKLSELAANIFVGMINPPPPRSRVPSWLRKALLRGLSKNPEDRYPSMDALLVALSRDPARTARRVLLAGGILSGAMLLMLAPLWIQHRADQRCRGGARRLAGIWDAPRRAAIQAALSGTGKPYARDAWLHIAPFVDRYAGGWISMYTEACLATQVRGEQSPALLDLRMACLDQRLDDLASFTALLSRADPAVIENGVQAASDLPALNRCADRQALTATLPPPEGPARAQIAALYRQLSAVRAEQKGGRLAEVRSQALALAEKARKTGYPPLHAEAAYLLADIEQQLGDMQGAVHDLHEAAAEALAGRHHVLAAEAFNLLGLVLGYNEREPEQGLGFAQLARAELDAIGGHEAVRARLLTTLGNIYNRQGRHDEAVRSFRESAALSRALHGPDSLDEADSLNDEGAVLQAENRFDEAISRYREALRIMEQVLGPQHPSVATTLRNIGVALRYQGRLSESAAYVTRALSIWRQALGADHPRTVTALLTLGAIRREQGRLEESQGLYEAAIKLLDRQEAAEPNRLVLALDGLSQTLRKAGREVEAVAPSQRIVALGERRHEPQLIVRGLLSVGESLLRQGHPEQARPLFERAEAQQMLGVERKDPATLAKIRFGLARALPNRDRPQARHLAEQARDDFQLLGEKERAQLEEVVLWLSRQPNH